MQHLGPDQSFLGVGGRSPVRCSMVGQHPLPQLSMPTACPATPIMPTKMPPDIAKSPRGRRRGSFEIDNRYLENT